MVWEVCSAADVTTFCFSVCSFNRQSALEALDGGSVPMQFTRNIRSLVSNICFVVVMRLIALCSDERSKKYLIFHEIYSLEPFVEAGFTNESLRCGACCDVIWRPSPTPHSRGLKFLDFSSIVVIVTPAYYVQVVCTSQYWNSTPSHCTTTWNNPLKHGDSRTTCCNIWLQRSRPSDNRWSQRSRRHGTN